jgi:molybdenum cofactor cytidylyltransferase
MGSDHVAVLLAAGGSIRMGTPKQLLRRDGEPLVRHVARLLLATQPRELVVVLGAHREAVAQALDGLAHRCVVNDAWASGLASSLRVAAAQVVADRILIAVCDQPALDGTHLERLLSARTPCAATDYAGRGGVPAVVDRWLWGQVDALKGDRGLTRLLNEHHDLTCFDFPELDFDLDTPADLAAARLRGWID